jgi:hypothetical protein
MTKKGIFTICAKNYLAQAFSLGDSLKQWHPSISFFILLSDEIGDTKIETEYKIIEAKTLDINGFYEMAFMYDVIEFSTSIKPYFIEKLFKEGYQEVLYIDPDMFVYNTLDILFDELATYDALLTPHLVKPYINYTGATSEEEILFVGIYNLGFFGIRNSETGNHIIKWWMAKLRNQCFADKEEALHVDQKWMDFLPSLYHNNVKIITHPGVNTAFWNLHERNFFDHNSNFTIDNLPLLIFHFSGFDPEDVNGMCKKQTKYSLTTYPQYKRLFFEYYEMLKKNNLTTLKKLPYKYDFFENTVRIIKFQRRLYRTVKQYYKEKSPFTVTTGSYYDLLRNKKMLILGRNAEKLSSIRKNITNTDKKIAGLKFILYLIKKIAGIKIYYLLIKFLYNYSRFEKQDFLIK